MDVVGLSNEQPHIMEVNTGLERRERSKSLVVTRRGSWSPGKDLETVLQQLFGVK